jgi:hypothetical protein
MNEWVLLLTMLTTERPVPGPPVHAARVSAVEPKREAKQLSEADRRELYRAAWKLSRHATGELRLDPASGFYDPVNVDAITPKDELRSGEQIKPAE